MYCETCGRIIQGEPAKIGHARRRLLHNSRDYLIVKTYYCRRCVDGDDLAGRRPVRVVKSCDHEEIDERRVEVLNIESDIQGADLLTFMCPACGRPHISYRK